MDPRLLRYYNNELQHVREMGAEFAQAFPKIAGRLGLEGFECADPYVERLLEGFAFLAARVQLKIDEEFPRFSQHLLRTVYPHYLAPTPSMAIVQLQPDLTEGSLANGFVVPRGTALRSVLGKNDRTASEYTTAHDVTLWPIELIEAKYFTYAGDLSVLGASNLQGVRAGLRLRLRATAGLSFDKLAVDTLCFYLRGSEDLPTRVYEQLFTHTATIAVLPTQRPLAWSAELPTDALQRVGFDDGEALLPYGPRSFNGYRLLHEYFVFPQRYLFFKVTKLQTALKRATSNEIDLILLLRHWESGLEAALDASNFALYATPAVNLFSKRVDRIHLSDSQHEYHVVPDRTRPMDYEVFDVTRMVGYGTSAQLEQEFHPLYATTDFTSSKATPYYTLRRMPRILSTGQREKGGARTSYVGSEVFVAIVDQQEAPFPTDLRQLELMCLCTNRDLPLTMAVGVGKTDFTADLGGPIQSVQCLTGPTMPLPAHSEGDTTWRLISHLSLNYLSLSERDNKPEAAALKELLKLYTVLGDAALEKQIDGITSIASKSIIRRMPTPGPITFGRGLEVVITFDDAAYVGSGVFLLGRVLAEFFTKYASVNQFVETVVHTVKRGEIIRWPARIGRREIA